MNKEQSQQMFGVDDISVWLNDICCSNTFAKEGKAETVISLLSDVQELSFGNNGDMIRTSINRIKYLLFLSPEEELERRIVGKLMHYLESKGFEVVGDEADNTPLGYGCTWLWRESDLLDLSRQIACALYPGPERRDQV